jgi:hypothetical protein
MNDTLQQVLPVVLSILVIIVIAVLQAYSKTLAAITATMPLTIPLALWIIYAAEDSDRDDVTRFTESLLTGVVATLIFTATLWLASRAGLGLVPMLIVAYLAWGAALGLHFAIWAYLLP